MKVYSEDLIHLLLSEDADANMKLQTQGDPTLIVFYCTLLILRWIFSISTCRLISVFALWNHPYSDNKAIMIM